MPFFRPFWVKNGHFQDKKPINQLVLDQFYRISALQITGYSSSMGLHAGIPKQIMFGPKIQFFDHFGDALKLQYHTLEMGKRG